MTAIDCIFAHAHAAPGRTAVIHDGQALSYAGFAARIAAARGFAQASGVDPARVAVLFINDILQAWIVGLALRSLGVTTVNGRDLGDLETLALPAVIVVRTSNEDPPGLDAAAAAIGARVLVVPHDLAGDLEAVEAPVGPQGDHILLTSGTTGVYKKVLYTAASEGAGAARRSNTYGFSADTVLNVFSFGGWTALGYFYPLCVWRLGGVVIVSQTLESYRTLVGLAQTHLVPTPSLLAGVLKAPPECPIQQPGAMLVCTGGPLPATLWRQARERVTHDVRTGMGSTEIGAYALTPIAIEDDLSWHRIDPDHELQIISDDGTPAPVGEMGGVRIRTTTVEGYLDAPEATAAFFRDGYFHPGDLAVAREDGRVALRGRVTDVINVMGQKLGVLPLESALQDRLGAAAVCVLSVPSPGGEAVHVAIQLERVVSMSELRDALNAVLPWAAQARAHKVEAMPRNHMGKIDRMALRALLFPLEDAD